MVAADLSPAQLALVELKVAAVRNLEHAEALAFLGVEPAGAGTLHPDRLATFDRLSGELTPAARAYWQARRPLIAAGVLHQGRFEEYFRLFRTRILPLVHRRRTVLALLTERSRDERRRFYDDTWDNWRWRLIFRLFFSRFAMGRLGRDPEFFRYVEGSVADRILERCRYALTELDPHRNPYVEYILTGNFARRRPRWLEPDVYRALGANLDRLTLVHGPVQEAGRRFATGAAGSEPTEGFDGFNLSDIFEYLDTETVRAVYEELLAVARPGARLAYWNLLVPRRCPEPLRHRVRPRPEADGLFARDRAFFYSAFVLEEAR